MKTYLDKLMENKEFAEKFKKEYKKLEKSEERNIYKHMWESLKSAKCGNKELETSLKALMKDIEVKYWAVTLSKKGKEKIEEALKDVKEGRVEKI